METALVTGALGMLGTEVADVFGAEYDVVGVDVEDFDITDASSARSAVLGVRPALVVNCAAYTDVDGAETDRDRAMAVNGAGAGNLAAAAREASARIMHVSTDYVFDGSKGAPYTEDDSPNPINAYGVSKLAGERSVAESGAEWTMSPITL